MYAQQMMDMKIRCFVCKYTIFDTFFASYGRMGIRVKMENFTAKINVDILEALNVYGSQRL